MRSAIFFVKKLTEQEAVISKAFPNPGFADYDLLPGELKQRMEELIKNDTTHRYSFYYFFKTDDINRHYYLDDLGLEVGSGEYVRTMAVVGGALHVAGPLLGLARWDGSQWEQLDTGAPGTVLLYGHYDKQPEFDGWEPGLGPWEPVLRDGKILPCGIYGRWEDAPQSAG